MYTNIIKNGYLLWYRPCPPVCTLISIRIIKKKLLTTKYIYVTTNLHTQNERNQSHVIIFYSESMGGDNYYWWEKFSLIEVWESHSGLYLISVELYAN